MFQLKYVVITPSSSSADGVCGTEEQSITIRYDQNDTSMNLTYSFTMDSKNNVYHMNSFLLTAHIKSDQVNINGQYRSLLSDVPMYSACVI